MHVYRLAFILRLAFALAVASLALALVLLPSASWYVAGAMLLLMPLSDWRCKVERLKLREQLGAYMRERRAAAAAHDREEA